MPTSRKASNQPFDESELSKKANPRNPVVRSGSTSRSQIQGNKKGEEILISLVLIGFSLYEKHCWVLN